MSVRIMADVWASSEAKGNDRLVLLALADHANDEDRTAWPSIAHLERKCRLSRRTIFRALEALAQAGDIRIIRATGVVNHYVVHPCQSDTRANVTPVSESHPTRANLTRGTGANLTPPPCQSDTLTIREPPRREPSEEPSLSATARFDAFWSAYPKRTGKKAAREQWTKLKPDAALVARIMDAVATQKTWSQWQRDGGQFIPDPFRWLRDRRWEDEPPTVQTPVLTPRGQQALDAGKEWLRRTAPPKGTALVRIP